MDIYATKVYYNIINYQANELDDFFCHKVSST